MPFRSRVAPRLLSIALFAIAGVSIASCGSRTGLFGVFDASVADASVDVIEEPTPCIPGPFDFVLATAQLMFVIDRSGSMGFMLTSDEVPLNGEPTRWQTLQTALAATLTPFDQQLSMGAKFFPEVITEAHPPASVACQSDTGVGIPPARGNVNPILGVFDSTSPAGGTPTDSALKLAALDLASRRTVVRNMVLATDGAPNCNAALDQRTCTCTLMDDQGCVHDPDGAYSCLDDQATVATIGDIFQNQKVPVYVIGIGGAANAQFLQTLDAMAVAGGRPRDGTPKHYNVQTADEMQTALTTISNSIAKCTYLTPSSPEDPNAIVVDVDGQPVARDPTHQNGWDWIDQTYGEIAFFGAACTAAGSGSASVTGVVTCSSD